jgi:hypothetical protein
MPGYYDFSVLWWLYLDFYLKINGLANFISLNRDAKMNHKGLNGAASSWQKVTIMS